MKMFLAFLVLTLAIFPSPIQMAQGAEKEILLLHTNSVKGHLFPALPEGIEPWAVWPGVLRRWRRYGRKIPLHWSWIRGISSFLPRRT